jgi:enamine deaminase RidA (YjgF/YER057c/UK114 family)
MSRPYLGLLMFAAVACAPATAPYQGPGGMPYPGAAGPPVYLQAPGIPGIEGFSSAVKSGLVVYLAGQVALDSLGDVVGGTDRVAQLRQAMANVAGVVRYARGVPADLVALTVYCVDCQAADFHALQGEIAASFPDSTRPALTMLGITALPEPGLLVAVSGVAILHGEFPDRMRDNGAAGQAVRD